MFLMGIILQFLFSITVEAIIAANSYMVKLNLLLFMNHVCLAFLSVYCSLVVTGHQLGTG